MKQNNNEKKMVKESEKKYKDFFNKSADSMLIIEENDFVDCNKATLKLLGYDNKKELFKCHPSDLSPKKQPDGKPSFEKANEMMDIAYKQGWHRFEWDHKKKDGTVFPVEVSLTAISKGSKKILHTVWRDISERKQAEERLWKSEQELWAIYENAPMVMVLIDKNKKIRKMNIPAVNMSGLTPEESSSFGIGKILHCINADNNNGCGFEPECKFCKINNAVIDTFKSEKGNIAIEAPVTCQTKAGLKKRWVFLSTSLLKLHEEKLVLVCMEDITMRKQAEENIRISNLKWQTTFDSINDSRCLIDIDGNILQHTSATKNFTKIKDKNLEGMNCCKVFHVSPELEKSCPFTKMKESKKIESKLVQIDNKWTNFYVYPIFDDSGNLIQAVHIAKDYTGQKQSENILLKTSRIEATTTLAAGVAHDFNNLMVGVLGNAELVKMKYKLEKKAVTMLDNIITSALKAGDLAKQLLAFAKGGKYHPEVTNLNDTIREALDLNKISVPERIIIKKNIEPDLWNVMADPVQMNQALMNLCINSVESINKKGKIIITSKNIEVDETFAKQHHGLKAGIYVCVTVEDTGAGMDKETLAKVFEPFFSTKFLGRGLGLATVFGIIKNNGGHIFVDSEPDKGTSFQIFLPALDVQKIIEKKKETEVVSGSETILVIDDDYMVLDVTKHILETFGYNVLVAHSGYEAIDICRQFKNKIHVALLDIGMPVFGGAEAFPILKDARPDMKIIICSGYELDGETQEILDGGADAFVQKPFKAGSLMMTIKNVLESDN